MMRLDCDNGTKHSFSTFLPEEEGDINHDPVTVVDLAGGHFFA